MWHDRGSHTDASASPALAEPQPDLGRWFGLEPWAVWGFLAWLAIMAYLRSLESQMPTDWVKLGLPLLAPYTRPIVDWKVSEKAILLRGLLIDDVNLLLYPVVFWSLLKSIALVRRRAAKCCARCFHQASRLALLAMPFDLIENLCLHRLVLGDTEPSGGFVRLLTVISLLKLALAFVAFCWLILGLVLLLAGRVWPGSADPRSGGATVPGPVVQGGTPGSSAEAS